MKLPIAPICKLLLVNPATIAAGKGSAARRERAIFYVNETRKILMLLCMVTLFCY